MSLRALKKKEFENLQRQERDHRQQKLQQQQQQQQQHQIYAQNNRNYFHKIENNVRNNNEDENNIDSNKNKLTSANSRFKSTPNLFEPSSSTAVTHNTSILKQIKPATDNFSSSNESEEFLRGHSESDLTKIPDNNPLVNAKSEFHLKTIASTKVEHAVTHDTDVNSDGTKKFKTSNRNKARQQRMPTRNSMVSSMMSSSMASSISDRARSGFADADNIRVPIIGYEVMEERARFTVYKLRVENPFTNDCWLVLRRYTDFQRLNNKLKTTFPNLNLALPRKKLFGDNFSSVFLSNRVQGLQLFINAVMGNETLKSSQIVRDFFCLDEPPPYSESMEECRAIFEAQEETIAHLKIQLRAKDEFILSLQQQLLSERQKNETMSTAMRLDHGNCSKCSKTISNLIKECQHND